LQVLTLAKQLRPPRFQQAEFSVDGFQTAQAAIMIRTNPRGEPELIHGTKSAVC